MKGAKPLLSRQNSQATYATDASRAHFESESRERAAYWLGSAIKIIRKG